MDFFGQQDRARRKTSQLTILFLVATVAIVAAVTVIVAVVFATIDTPHGGVTLPTLEWLSENMALLALSGLATFVFIGSASLYRLTSLRSGGGVVATELGGTVVHMENEDSLLRRLYNVVEEMAIASGVPVPEVYVMEQETGINAFAAGYTPTDAAVAVTRGTLERLNRQELQGVIAHEFSHILNGDMRLNCRLMGVIFGVTAIGMIGRTILHGARYSGARRSSRNGDGGVAPILLAGLALFIIGYLGVLFGRIIRSAISRQREFLADASAVQFTRETEGIAQALKKIGGYTQRSYLQSTRAEEIGHMLFALGEKRWFASLFATHPPLEERIKALDSNFDPSEYAKRGPRVSGVGHDLVAGLDMNTAESPSTVSAIVDTDSVMLDPRQFSNSAASPASEHLRYAARLRDSLPNKILESVHSFSRSSALIIALVLDRTEQIRRRQLSIVQQQMGASFVGLAEELFEELQRLSPAYRLPILDMAFPALKRRPLGHLQFVGQLVEKIIATDGEIDEFEYMLGKVFSAHLQDLEQPDRRMGEQGWDNPQMAAAAQSVISLVAKIGHRSEDEAKQAYKAGLHVMGNGFGAPLVDGQLPYAPPSPWFAGTDKALAQLDGLSGEAKRQLIDALTMAIRHDERVTLKEAELLRGICATLRVPVPPCVIQIFRGSC